MNLSAQERLNQPIKSYRVPFFKPLASLELTIVGLTCAMVLVFIGTLDQVTSAYLKHRTDTSKAPFSCALLVLGMLVQFGVHLVSFFRRRVIAFA
jgi:hypothetical protein